MLLRSGRKLKSLTMDDLNVTDPVGTDPPPLKDLFNDNLNDAGNDGVPQNNLTINDGGNDGVP